MLWASDWVGRVLREWVELNTRRGWRPRADWTGAGRRELRGYVQRDDESYGVVGGRMPIEV